MGHGGRIGTNSVFTDTTHSNSLTTGKGKMKGAATRTGTSGRSIDLTGIDSVRRFKGTKGSTGISCILILHTGLVHDNGVTGRIEGLSI